MKQMTQKTAKETTVNNTVILYSSIAFHKSVPCRYGNNCFSFCAPV